MTKVYSYSPNTGEYLDELEASLDPIEGKPLVPAFSTVTKPPQAHSNKAAVFKNNHWILVDDFRGTEYWLADGSSYTVEKIGAVLPPNSLSEKPKPTLTDLKKQAEQKIDSFGSNARAEVSDRADAYKLAGWNDKSQRAKRVINGTHSEDDLAVLSVECDKRGEGESPQQLAEIQSKKSIALATAVAIIDGMESAALKAVEAKRSASSLNLLLEKLEQEGKQQLEQLLQAEK